MLRLSPGLLLASLASLAVAGCGGSIHQDERGAPDDGGGSRDAALGDAGVRDTGPRDSALRDAAPEADAPAGDAASVSLVTVPLTGCTEASYTAEVTIGTQTFALLVDTGSTTLAVAADGCTNCGVTPLYTPGALAVDEHRPVKSEYGTSGKSGDTGWRGDVYEDAVSVGGPSTATRPAFAAIDSQSNGFFQTLTCGSSPVPFEGILGLAPPLNAIAGTVGYFDSLIASQPIPDVFATQLCDPGGYLWLGGYDPAHTTAPPQYVPYARSKPDQMVSAAFYSVNLEQILVEGMTVPIAAKGETNTILDTGNNSSFLPFDAYLTVTNAILADAGFQAAFGAAASKGGPGQRFFGVSGGGQCSTSKVGKAELDATLPSLTLIFAGNVSVTAMPTESYLIPQGGDLWCPALEPFSKGGKNPIVADLGSPILRSSVVIFDRAASRIGFAPHTPCP